LVDRSPCHTRARRPAQPDDREAPGAAGRPGSGGRHGATGLEVFDKTLQTTHTWLDEIMAELGPDRQIAWHTLGAVLHPLRDRLPLGLAAHLGAQLPLLVRGLYYDQWHSAGQPDRLRTLAEFLERVSEGLANIRPVNGRDATRAVFRTLSRHVDPGQIGKVVDALPEEVRALWLGAMDPAANGPAERGGQRDDQVA
jgi:uncharacterized protein (DUF2267 family)